MGGDEVGSGWGWDVLRVQVGWGPGGSGMVSGWMFGLVRVVVG